MFKDGARNLYYYDTVLTAVWLAGVALFIVMFGDLSTTTLQVSAALVVMIAISSNIEFRMSRGDNPIIYTPDAQPMALAALLLPPIPVMAVCVATLLDRYYFIHHIPWYKRTGLAGSVAIGAGTASAVVHTWLPEHASAMLLLPSALVAAGVYETVSTLLQAAMYELRTPGAGRELIRDTRNMTVISSILSAVVVVVYAGFVSNVVMLVGVFIAFQAATFAFTRLTASEALLRDQSEHLRDVFSRYVPAHVADEIADSSDDIVLGGEQRTITVLFADIRGFTSWSEQQEATAAVAQLNEVLGAMSAAVLDAEGTLDKFIGDGLMAFWGAPLEQPDHAVRAWHAACGIVDRLEAINERRQADGDPPFAIGIGIHTGPAIVGNIGHEARLEYTAVGDTVNTASRLESATKDVGEVVVVSHSTWELLPAAVRDTMTDIGAIAIRGKQQPVPIHAVSPTRSASRTNRSQAA